MESAHVIDVGEAEFETRVIDASRRKPVVVDFWAGWCRPCLVLSPILERLAVEHDGRFTLAKVDVDSNPGLASRFGIQGIPAVKAFREGRVVTEFVGAQPEENVRRFLDQVLPSAADDEVAAARTAESIEAAEAAFRRALEMDPAHPEAVAGLAGLLVERGEVDEAQRLLARTPADGPARRLQAEVHLRVAATERDELGAAAALAVRGDHGAALERWLQIIAAAGEERDAARDLMVATFEVLGDDHALTREYRSRLASALY